MTPQSQVRDTLADELEAIAAIGRALANVPDPVARVRILRWAVDRFLPTESPVVSTGAAANGSASAARSAVSATSSAVDQTLAVESLGELFAPEVPAQAALQQPAAGKQPVETLVRGFVSDFQRLVVEWQGV